MSALSGMFLWLIPLAFLPVIIHLLNRLRYRTVHWAAMMFLRTADRDASRRAKVRQWLILAARCLMLLMFLLALARLQSKGRLARFFDQGSNLVVVLFDRSASMEQQIGGTPARERALVLLQQGLAEMGGGTRVLWVDSATGEVTPLPSGVELDRLPMVKSTSTPADMEAMMRTALQEIARAGVPQAEIWIPTDRQTNGWIPEGSELPDWSDWAGTDTQITLRVLDVAGEAAGGGNRSLQITGPPVRDGDTLKVPMRLIRDAEAPESVPLQIDAGGLVLREDILVEGNSFSWDQLIEIEPGQEEVSAAFTIPADSNEADNKAVLAWRNRGALQARVELSDGFVSRVARAGLLPREGFRHITDDFAELTPDVSLWIREIGSALSDDEREWAEGGGVVLQLPAAADLKPVGEEDDPATIKAWNEQTGVLATQQREPLRLDLLSVNQAVALTPPQEDGAVLARLTGGLPLLIREKLGKGAVYTLATMPEPSVSNLADGYIWVPLLQRLLLEGYRAEQSWGLKTLGDFQPEDPGGWQPVDGEGDIRLQPGRYKQDNLLVAINRPLLEDSRDRLSMSEIEKWSQPLPMLQFGVDSEDTVEAPSRVEFTSLLAWMGLLFLAVESWLLTRNIRRPARMQSATTWKAAA